MHSRTELQRQWSRGERAPFIFFWRPEQSDPPGPGCLSQWYPSPFVIGGRRFVSAEQWMMAQKARIFGDEAIEAKIMATADPAEARRLGRRIPGFDEALWRERRVGVVLQGNAAKFQQDPALAAYLLSTDEAILVEASPKDRIWGVGLAAEDAAIRDPTQWPGENLLGFTLMAVRDALRSRRH